MFVLVTNEIGIIRPTPQIDVSKSSGRRPACLAAKLCLDRAPGRSNMGVSAEINQISELDGIASFFLYLLE